MALSRPHRLNLLNTGEPYEQQRPVKVPCRRSTPPQGRVTQGPLTMGACVRSLATRCLGRHDWVTSLCSLRFRVCVG